MESSQLESKKYTVEAVRTRIFHKGECLAEFVIDSLKSHPLQEEDLVVVTSKIVSLAENRTVPMTSTSKEALVRQEADHYLGDIAYDCFLTVKHGMMIASAGIDESNSENGDFILFPKDPYRSAHDLCLALKEKFQLKKLGVILTDSHTTPLRRGVTGIALAYWGFEGLFSQVDQPDLFGRKLKFTNINKVDALSAAATMVMGEGNDSSPLALVRGATVVFSEIPDKDKLHIPLKEDLYYPLLKNAIKEP
ncbi:MAG: coenzyme F420-0:L-glutamate ligase [Bdellovibrionales bacterium]|nr:coenzyme F420-0:L-glutamate ligase [Bdellovibrionales bacterium]